MARRKPPDKGGSQGDIQEGDSERHGKNQSTETESDAEKDWRLGEGRHHTPGGKYAEETGDASLGGLLTHVRTPCVSTPTVTKDVKVEKESADKAAVEEQGPRQ